MRLLLTGSLKVLLLLFAALIPIVFLLFRLIDSAGLWMVVSDPIPKRLDVIYTYAGEGVRNYYSRVLFDRHPETLWIVGRWPMRRRYYQALYNGVDSTRLWFMPTDSLNTHLEFLGLCGLLDSLAKLRPPGSPELEVGLVSGPYHMRRIFNDVLYCRPAGLAVRIHFLPVPFSDYQQTSQSYRSFWRSSHLCSLLQLELMKMAWYYLSYWAKHPLSCH